MVHNKINLRFGNEDIAHAQKRLGTTWENTVDIVKVFDRGVGDIDDVIDLYENTKPI